MWKQLWNLIKQREDLLTEAYDDAAAMLERDRAMFTIVEAALSEELSEERLAEIRRMDLGLNEQQQAVRRKVFEHLALSGGSDILSGLVLTSIVIDLERIGDYTKNIGEVVSLFPGRVDFGEDRALLDRMRDLTLELFDLTRRALVDQSESAARRCMERFFTLSRLCDEKLEAILLSARSGTEIERTDLALALLVRYIKRVGAHLKNIASATVQPFPKIGYKLPDRRDANG
jgi:phosphate transport system protein